ncbi:MAG TPA: hypothetical protein VL100_05785 [Croceibacterium sp.]|nr:hypothetical protein [Croceibacterium sp.]
MVADAPASVSASGEHHPQTPSSEKEGAEQRAAPLHANHFSREKQVRFLEALALWGSVRAACRAVPAAPQTVYRHRRASHDFALAWDAAMLVARPHVEDVLSDRALNGVEEPVFYHGEEIARRRRFDSRLLLAHLARLDKADERDEVRDVAGDFDAALDRLARGEPVDPGELDDDEDGPVTYGERWEDEHLPFAKRVELYQRWLDLGDGRADGADDDDDGGDDDDDDDQGAWGPEVSMEDIALLAARDDMAALDAIHTPRSEEAWVEDGHAARLAAYRAEAAVSSQDRVTPVTLAASGPGRGAMQGAACAGSPADASSRRVERSEEDARSPKLRCL